MKLAGIGPRQVLGVFKDARASAGAPDPIVVDGVLAAQLARELVAGGGDPSLVRVASEPDDASAYVLVVAGMPDADGLRRLRAADRHFVPTIVVQTDPRAEGRLPYVLATRVVRVPAGQGFPVDEIAAMLARDLGNRAVGLAARLPAIRPAIVAMLVRSASLRAGVIGAAPWIRGARFPILTLLQQRLVLDVAAAHGRELDPQQLAPELAAVTGSAFGARGLARRLRLPAAPMGAATGLGLTRAVGEAAVRRFARA